MLPGYDPDTAKKRAEARKIMEKLGYGPDNRLTLTLSSRNIPACRDPAVILIDQLKEIYIDAELEPVETANWSPRSTARATRSRSTGPRAAWTTPTSNSTRTSCAARCGTTRAIAMPRSTSWSTGTCSGAHDFSRDHFMLAQDECETSVLTHALWLLCECLSARLKGASLAAGTIGKSLRRQRRRSPDFIRPRARRRETPRTCYRRHPRQARRATVQFGRTLLWPKTAS